MHAATLFATTQYRQAKKQKARGAQARTQAILLWGQDLLGLCGVVQLTSSDIDDPHSCLGPLSA